MTDKTRLIQRLQNVTQEEFIQKIYPKREPVILTGLDIGPCCDRWTVDYLIRHGGCQEVKVHVCEMPAMDFLSKNFLYRSLPFGELVRRASEEIHDEFFLSEGEFYYLRALGEDPRREVANISKQFPALAADIHIPEFFPSEKLFSSVFRIASKGLKLWTHYDVMDNLLIQVSGHKRVVLFSPSEVENLYLNGDKSEVLDVDHPDLERFPRFPLAERYEGCLEPGDVIFIPALWFHHVCSLEFGVAVNVFWKHLVDDLYDPRDPYGNKDPLPAARAGQIVDRALKSLAQLPSEYQDFYARRLVAKIRAQAYLDSNPV